MRKLLFQNFLLRQYLQRQTIAIVFEFDPHFLIRKEAIIGGRRLFQILLTESLALNVLFYDPLIKKENSDIRLTELNWGP